MAIDQKPRRSTEREQEEGEGRESLREYSQRYDPLGAPPPYHYHSTSSSSSSPPEGMHETQPHSESTPLLSGQESQRSHDVRAAPWAPAWQRKPLSARRKRVVNVCLVLVLLTLIIVSMREWATHSSSEQPDSGSAPGSGSGDYPLPPSPAPNDGNPKSRASWSSPVERPDYLGHGGPWYSSVANFTLKYTPDWEAVWLHALGVSYRGHITVVGDSAVKEGEGEAGVEAFFRSVREREHAVWVGEMKRGEKDEGLGVYGHRHRADHSQVAVEVRIHLALPPSSVAPLLPPLEVVADTLDTSWEVDASDPVVSRSLDIQLGAGGLRVGAIQTQQHTNIALHAGSVKPTSTSASSPHLSGSIRCANLAIRLDSGSLRLASIEARNQAAIRSHAGSVRLGNLVSPEVKVVSNAGSVEGTFEVGERLDVQSDAGHVALDVKLPARTDNHTVQARAHSNAGSVRVTYVEQGKGVTLDSSVTSGTGRVEVKHHPSFEGSFDLLTRVGRLDVSPPRGSGAGGGDEREWVVREDRKGWTGRHVVGRVGREGMEGRTIVKSEAGAMQVVF